MPANDCLRPDDSKGAGGRGEPAIEPDKQQAIDVCQGRSLGHPPAKHVDLLPQNQNLRLEFGPRLKERSRDTKNQLEQIDHQTAILRCSLHASTPNRILDTHSLNQAPFSRTRLNVLTGL